MFRLNGLITLQEAGFLNQNDQHRVHGSVLTHMVNLTHRALLTSAARADVPIRVDLIRFRSQLKRRRAPICPIAASGGSSYPWGALQAIYEARDPEQMDLTPGESPALVARYNQ